MTRASKTLVTAEEYLKMSSDGPEPDYLDGELKERHLGSSGVCGRQYRR